MRKESNLRVEMLSIFLSEFLTGGVLSGYNAGRWAH